MKKRYKQPGWVPMVNVIRDREFTIAFGEYFDENFGSIPFAGATKKNPQDHENHDRGERLAIGNAFRHLGRGILKAEYDAIHQQFHTKPKHPKKKVDKSDNCCGCVEPSGCYELSQDPKDFDVPYDYADYDGGFEDGYRQAVEDMKE